jgi:hypothetical protein
MRKLTMWAVIVFVALSAGTAARADSISTAEAIEYLVAHPEFGCQVAGNDCTEGWQARLDACQREIAISKRLYGGYGPMPAVCETLHTGKARGVPKPPPTEAEQEAAKARARTQRPGPTEVPMGCAGRMTRDGCQPR